MITIKNLEIPDVKLITPKVFNDPRGYFFEAYNQDRWVQAGITTPFIQDNQSQSQAGTLRGLHFQNAPHPQAKLIRVLSGKIFDVAVDIRPNSPTYGKWVGRTLSAETPEMMLIPEGFAHGFYALSDHTTILYKCSDLYHPECEGSIRWNDPTLGIKWPLDPSLPLIVSEKDQAAPLFKR
jgi:dTDP-4-dehydrorhamnose 3,5-epimerase